LKVEFIQTWKIQGKQFGLLKLPAPISPNNIRQNEKVSEEDMNFIKDLATNVSKYGMQQLPICSPKDGIFVGRNRYLASEINKDKAILVEIQDIDAEGQKTKSYVENSKRKQPSFMQEAKHLWRMKDEHGLSGRQIAGSLGEPVSSVAHKLRVYEKIINVSQGDTSIIYAPKGGEVEDKRVDYQVTYAKARELVREDVSEEDREILTKRIKSEGMTRDQVTKAVNSAKKMESRLGILESTHPEIAKEMREYWYPLRHESIYSDMEADIGQKIGKYKSVEYFYPEERFTEEEMKKYAKDHLGEYLGKITKTWYRVFIVPKTSKELRQKWQEKRNSILNK